MQCYNNCFYCFYEKRSFHGSPRLSFAKKSRSSTKSIQINAFDEEIFPNHRSQIKYEQELALKDKIRSARIARRHKLHEIYTLKFAQLMFEVLLDTLQRNELKPAIIKWKDLGYLPPEWIDHQSTETEEQQSLLSTAGTKTDYSTNAMTKEQGNILQRMEDLVQINLRDVGFEICAVTMPNHRQYCVLWWQYNSICKFPAGIHVCKYVLELYKNTLRAVLARKINLKYTPRLIFKLSEDPQMQALEYKQKMDDLLEIAVLNGVENDFRINSKIEKKYNSDGKNPIGYDIEYEEYVNQSVFDTLLDYHYGDYHHVKDEKATNAGGKSVSNNRYKHWMDIYTKRIYGKFNAEEEEAKRKRKKVKHYEKRREKSKILNMILSADANAQNYSRSFSKNAVEHTQIEKKPYSMRGKGKYTTEKLIIGHKQDLDLVGLV